MKLSLDFRRELLRSSARIRQRFIIITHQSSIRPERGSGDRPVVARTKVLARSPRGSRRAIVTLSPRIRAHPRATRGDERLLRLTRSPFSVTRDVLVRHGRFRRACVRE